MITERFKAIPNKELTELAKDIMDKVNFTKDFLDKFSIHCCEKLREALLRLDAVFIPEMTIDYKNPFTVKDEEYYVNFSLFVNDYFKKNEIKISLPLAYFADNGEIDINYLMEELKKDY